ncbi:MAG: hypothetical protein A3A96_02855 [Candidatus Zambryskibacteria bacterium RIFCSPLOWO2_01_FULL_39_39]|uniref:Uncharacterized protein n=1 Tax=Candidatus Zambryskibacteria bacterium RIFCSPLOWO2_01_FULL_39_39 TaxID=1802758 RepID=A0A1G2TWB2_9BACT|nr:MAG: hypothetical protein UT00_C0002G0049 [Parcubacteria group bacterium GW2011_GWA1_38_7]OHA94459.1 MAG: hypothetical protein A3B88_02065 [Candidatus Zambryskibacteria bacterium RIFCSPHIGHO2_02_FULL_39_19]OHB01587.1 MAG: hypothetical protein A3A96_02855 [Candidatus Zambryskibacteria bacterium RIFCSPLOWO2_01_FULL_39_39]
MEQKTIATTETMTQEQARQIGDRFVAKFPKAGTNFPKDIVQGVSDDEMEELIAEFIESLKTRVEHRAKVIIRHFKVDRTKTPAQLLSACNRVPWYVDETVLATMPMDGPEEGDLLFFPLEKDTPVADISRVFEERGLVPDYAAQMQVNADDQAFADKHPNGMQWAKNSYVYFYRRGDGRKVHVDSLVSFWLGSLWFAGRRK